MSVELDDVDFDAFKKLEAYPFVNGGISNPPSVLSLFKIGGLGTPGLRRCGCACSLQVDGNPHHCTARRRMRTGMNDYYSH